MQIKLWGTRGSLAAPVLNSEYRQKLVSILQTLIKQKIKDEDKIDGFIDSLPPHLKNFYGGNTTCVSVTGKDGSLVILDCGTGIRPLGDELMRGSAGKGAGDIRIMMTHTHWDHVQGLPFFKPIYVPGNVLHFYAPFDGLKERFMYQQENRFFPAPFEGMKSTKEFHRIHPGENISFGSMSVDCYPLKHPGGSHAYRFREDGRTFVFATDAEFTGDYLESLDNKTDFFMDADLLVLDSQYTLDESFLKFDWGHTSYTMAVNCGIHWRVKNLILTHHEPSYSDFKLFEIYNEAIEHREQMNNGLPAIHMGTEGAVYHIGEGVAPPGSTRI